MSAPQVRPIEPPKRLEDLTKEELIARLESVHQGGIRIDFVGKANARTIARKVRPRVLSTDPRFSAGLADERAKNLLIEGDNLQAMATLYRERGQVDLILTDPPYNTGSDWRYNDKWEEDPNDTDVGDWVSADDGARHTKWMKFMWPRLQMMKEMLRPGGVLAICIDFRELFRLGQMLDELFGEKNRLGILNWQRTYSRTSDAGHLAVTTEYVLVYAHDEDKAYTALLPRTDDDDAKGNPDADPRAWTDGPATASNAKAHKSMVYAIQNPWTGDMLYPPQGSAWRYEQASVLQWLAGWGCEYELRELDDQAQRAALIGVGVNEVPEVQAIVLREPVEDAQAKAQVVYDSGVWPRIFFLKKGRGRPRYKKYRDELQAGLVPTTFWADEDYETPAELGSVSWSHRDSGHSQQGVDELTEIVGSGHEFKTVKPLKLFRKLVQIWCPAGGLVLDPFAGSGTTGHAVLALNKEHDADRRFILIEQGRPDKGDSYARSLTADRLRRVVSGTYDKPRNAVALGGGFRFASLAKKVDAEALLSMEREELADTIIGSHFDANGRSRPNLTHVPPSDGFEYLMARNNANEGFFLIWSGPNGKTNFDAEAYEQCVEEAERAGLSQRYHVYGRLFLYQSADVVFYPIPDRILLDFGLDLRGEPYFEA